MALPSFFCFVFLCFFVYFCAVFSCFHATDCEAHSFTNDGYGIFNVRTNVGACRTHVEAQAQTSLQKSLLSGGTEKLSLTLPDQGIEPMQGFRI